MQDAISVNEYRKLKQPKKRAKREESLQIQLANYMRMKRPDIIFRSDFAAGIKMSMPQAVKHKRMQHSRAYPDFFIAKPVGINAGLFIELKQSKEGVYLKDGRLSKDKHIQEQAEMLRRLTVEGYKAVFACGIDEAISVVESYLEGL